MDAPRKVFVWPTHVAPVTTTLAERRALPPARPAATPNPPPPPAPQETAVISMRFPYGEKPPRPAFNPRYAVHATEEVVARTEAAWRSETLQAAIDTAFAELNGSEPQRRADGLTYDDVLGLVRKEWPQLREGPMRSVTGQKFYNPAITDQEIWEELECFYGAWWEKNPRKAKLKLAARLFH